MYTTKLIFITDLLKVLLIIKWISLCFTGQTLFLKSVSFIYLNQEHAYSYKLAVYLDYTCTL